LKSVLRNGRVIRLGALPGNKCFTVDLKKDDSPIEKIPDKTLLYVLIAIGIINLIKN